VAPFEGALRKFDIAGIVFDEENYFVCQWVTRV
jgi:hypothetical protein